MRELPRYMVEREGRYWSRLVVPVDLRPYLDGKTELRTPLGGDYRAALKAHHGSVADLQHRIAVAERQAVQAKGRPVEGRARYPLRPDQLARAHYLRRLAWDEELRDDPRYHLGYVNEDLVSQLRAGIAGRLDDDGLEAAIGDQMERFRVMGNMDATKGSPEWRAAARALCVAEYEALARVAERDDADFDGVPAHPMLAKALEEPEPLPPVSLRGLFRDYVKARSAVGRARSTDERWTPVVESLVAHLRHDDARRITKADLLGWRDKLLETKSAKTVADVDLAAARAILRWAHENERLPANVAAGVKQAKPKAVRAREKGYTDAEAVALLKIARAYMPRPGASKSTSEGAELTRAKRWVPWLCAFTGARVTEMTQLRAQDFREVAGAWVVRITPDAGSVKTAMFRDVPVHPQLVELGLLDLVKEVGTGPIFWRDHPVGRDPLKASRTVSGRLSDWIGTLKIAQDIQPNYGWRHRMKSVAMELGVAGRVLDSIQGHPGRTASDLYGDVSIAAKRKVIEAFPPYELD